MYDDPRDVRYIRKAIYVSERETEAIKTAAMASGRQPAAFIRDATMVVARFIQSKTGQVQSPDLISALQSQLQSRRPGAANDDNIMLAAAG